MLRLNSFFFMQANSYIQPNTSHGRPDLEPEITENARWTHMLK